MSTSPKVSVVVVNHNGGDLVRRSVESAIAQDYPNYEVLVVDNGSDDGSLAGVLASPRLETSPVRTRVLRLARNMGCGGGRNAGIQASEGEVVGFLDADAVAPAGWLSSVVETMESGERVGIVASTSLSMRNPRVLQSQGGALTLSGHAIDLGFGEPWEFTQIAALPSYAMGNGLVARREVFEQVGHFDDGYRNYYEDVDFCLRAQLAGYEIRACRTEPLLHYGGYSNETFGDKTSLLERHRIRTVLKLYGGSLLWRWLGREAFSLIGGGAGTTRGAHLRAWRWNLSRLGAILASRRRFRLRLRSPLDLPTLMPIWGPPRSVDHGLVFAPESADLEQEIQLGDADSKAIAFGFYWPEEGLGERFRWTNGLGSLVVRSVRPIHQLVLRLHSPRGGGDEGPSCLLVLLDRARDVFFAGSVESAGSGWQDYAWTVDAPRGNYELLLVSRSTALEPHGWCRRLGVAVASVRSA